MSYGPARVLGEMASHVVTWRQYGAVGDGVADDSDAINACMLDASQNGYLVSTGIADERFRITKPIDIYDNTRLTGRGKGVTVVVAERCAGFDMAGSCDDQDGITTNFEIQGLTVLGDDNVAVDGLDHIGLHLRRAASYRIENVEVRGFTDACVIDGRKNIAGTSLGNGDGRFIDCGFETDNIGPQINPTNNYPRYLVEVAAEANGVGGAAGVSFYNCRMFGENIVDDELRAGDGSMTSFSFGPITAGKSLTDPNHVSVQYVSTAGGGAVQLVNGDDYTVDGVTDPTTPVFDFASGSDPLGAVAQVTLLTTAGDGVARAFRLSARPSFPDAASGRGVKALVGGVEQTAGDAYEIVDGANKTYTFVADDSDDTLTIGGSGAGELAAGRIVRVSSDGTLPAELSTGIDYYATEISGDQCKLAASYADAVASTPTPIDLTDAGAGVHSLTVQHAIEFAAAPDAAQSIGVDDENIRLRWIDPNVEACIKLCRGAQRIGFFSCLVGGGKIGIDFSHAKRCTAIDAYFQIHEWAVQFDQDAAQNTLLGFSSRTDHTLLKGFINDQSVAETNSFDSFLARGSSIRDHIYLKESFDEADLAAGRLRKASGQVQLDALDAAGSVRLGVGGSSMIVADGAAGRTSVHDAAGVEIWRFDSAGDATPRLASGSQNIGAAGNLVDQVHANGLALADGVAAPSATAGLAKIFVDTADGDLKVVFGDGTVKTIVVDT